MLARLHGVDLHVVDVGVDADFKGVAGLHHHKVANGTCNMLRKEAMDNEQMTKALNVGAKLASDAAAAGQSLVAIGEMGIGNTMTGLRQSLALSPVRLRNLRRAVAPVSLPYLTSARFALSERYWPSIFLTSLVPYRRSRSFVVLAGLKLRRWLE